MLASGCFLILINYVTCNQAFIENKKNSYYRENGAFAKIQNVKLIEESEGPKGMQFHES